MHYAYLKKIRAVNKIKEANVGVDMPATFTVSQ